MQFQPVSKPLEETKPVSKVVTKEERIKEANTFWKAFFTAHSTKNVGDLKPKKKRRKIKKDTANV